MAPKGLSRGRDSSSGRVDDINGALLEFDGIAARGDGHADQAFSQIESPLWLMPISAMT